MFIYSVTTDLTLDDGEYFFLNSVKCLSFICRVRLCEASLRERYFCVHGLNKQGTTGTGVFFVVEAKVGDPSVDSVSLFGVLNCSFFGIDLVGVLVIGGVFIFSDGVPNTLFSEVDIVASAGCNVFALLELVVLSLEFVVLSLVAVFEIIEVEVF